MKNTFGQYVSVTLFGESHGECIGAVLDGLPAGYEINDELIKKRLYQRRPSGEISTSRAETDEFDIASGVFGGKTTGAPLCIIIKNSDVSSTDYEKNHGIARPSHADLTAHIKYSGFEDYRGGGHLSGRITAALVAAGSICEGILKEKNIFTETHILSCGGVSDRKFSDVENDMKILSGKDFPVLSDDIGDKMKAAILAAKRDGDSVGGVTETAVLGLPAGVGDPLFDSLESVISHIMFAIPAVKGVQFGAGFDFASMRGSDANDDLFLRDGKIATDTNNSGGINGGISNGMPIIFSCAVRPTPSIAKEQRTVDFLNNKETVISCAGRHDPSILPRICPVITAATSIALCSPAF